MKRMTISSLTAMVTAGFLLAGTITASAQEEMTECFESREGYTIVEREQIDSEFYPIPMPNVECS